MNGGGRHFYKQIHTTGIVFHHRPFLKSQQQQTVNMVCCIWYICYFVCYKRFLHARKPQSCHIGGLIIYIECQINLIILMFQISITCQPNHKYYNTHFTVAILQCSGDDICYNLEYFIFIDKTTNRKKMKNLHYTHCVCMNIIYRMCSKS